MKTIEIYLSCFFILVGGVIFGKSLFLPYNSEFSPGCGFLPLWVSGIMIALCIFNLVVAVKNRNPSSAQILPRGIGLKNVLACIGGYGAFVITVPYFGFSVSSMLLLYPMFSRGFSWYWALVWSTVLTGSMFIIFSLVLGVPLPVNAYGW